MPIVSIIIPAYNASKLIEECIESIINQDFHDWELILINDGSTDDTLEKCERYTSAYSNIKLLDQRNQGVSAARNNGLGIAQGEYVLFMDADDYLPNNSLSIFYKTLLRFPTADIIRGEYDAIDRNRNKLFTSNKKVFNKNKFYPEENIDKFFLKYIKFEYFLWVMWIKRSKINNIRFIKGRTYMEDTEFLFSVLNNVRFCVYVPQIVYNYRKYEGAASYSLNNKKLDDITSCILSLSEQIHNHSNLRSTTIISSIDICWNIVFNYIITIKNTKRNILIDKFKLREKAKQCVTMGYSNTSDLSDFIKEDIDTFVTKFNQRQKLRNRLTLGSRILSSIKAQF